MNKGDSLFIQSLVKYMNTVTNTCYVQSESIIQPCSQLINNICIISDYCSQCRVKILSGIYTLYTEVLSLVFQSR